MRILVIGGAGYVGSHCVRRLIAAGHDVTVYDNLSAGHRAAVNPKALFVHGDLADARKLDAVVAAGRFDAALHFAAFLNVGESVTQPVKYWRNNVAHTLNLLDALQQHNVRRLVFSSTCAVYGVPENLPITETTAKNPINPYGATKLAVERILEDCAAAWGLGAIALRYFNASGAAVDGSIGEDHSPELHLIPIVLEVALGKRPHVSVFGTDYPTPDGSCIRDYIHVEDLAEAHLLALDRCEAGRFEAFNCGTGKGFTVLQVIETARTLTGHAIPAQLGPRRPGDPAALFADATRLREATGWKPRYVALAEIIETAWRWHQAHPHGYRGE